jgi:hypothetical protein
MIICIKMLIEAQIASTLHSQRRIRRWSRASPAWALAHPLPLSDPAALAPEAGCDSAATV